MMPKKLVFLLIGLVLGTWFLMGGRKSVGEKVGLLIGLVIVYVTFRLLTGSTLDEIIAPLFDTSGFVGPEDIQNADWLH